MNAREVFRPVRLLLILGGVLAAMGWRADALGQVPSQLFTPGRSFSMDDNVVTSVVFSWYTSTGGQISGPWIPLGGRASWDGGVEFWQDQIKQIMAANIDVIYVHTIPHMTTQRGNMLTGLEELRRQGYQTPQIAPFLDSAIIWNSFRPPADLSTAEGKNAYVNEFKAFYHQYYSTSSDPYADSALFTIDARPVLNTYVLPARLINSDSFSRSDLESRLAAEYGGTRPTFNNGVYMTGNHEFDWQDESFVQYGSNSYHSKRTFNDRKVITVKPGYWDQNIRDPGAFLPRNGGDPYRDAWDYVRDVKDGGWSVDGETYAQPVHRVSIESWNEYDEGSGIYAGDAGEPYVAPSNTSGNTDTWSNTGDPWEYIKTTAEGARHFNDTPDRDASILYHDMPAVMNAGETRTVHVVVRNEGDLSWTAVQNFKFGQKEHLQDEVLFGPARHLMDDTQNEIPIYGGAFRGRPITFEVELVAPSMLGDHLTHWGMLQEHVAWFGEELVVPITVVPAGDLNQDGFVGQKDLDVVLSAWGSRPPNDLRADPDGNGLVAQGDLDYILDCWGQGTPPPYPVPEPAAVAMLAICGLALLRRKPKSR